MKEQDVNKESVVEEVQLQAEVEVQESTNADEAETAVANVEEATTVDAEEHVSEETEGGLDEDALAQIDNMNKHEAAVLLVTKTKHIVNDAEKQMDACRMLLSDDLQAYEDAKSALHANALDESQQLLEELGYEADVTEADAFEEENSVVFEAKEERPPFYVKDVSSGKFGSFILSLLVGTGTVAGFAYYAASKTGVTLDPSKLPSVDTLKSLAAWYGTLINGKEDLMVGGALVGGVTVVLMWLVYGIRVSGKAKRNLAFAKQQLEEAQEYAAYKGNCKTEMDKVDAHMNDAIETLKSYEVILTEQNGKLKRVIHIEGIKEVPSEYHEKSLKEMADTQMLVGTVKAFMNTPMSEEGKLSGKSTMLLEKAKNKLQQVIDRLY